MSELTPEEKAIKPGPGGDLFYLSLITGTLQRIVYDGS
jgi:hypothetical protein